MSRQSESAVEEVELATQRKYTRYALRVASYCVQLRDIILNYVILRAGCEKKRLSFLRIRTFAKSLNFVYLVLRTPYKVELCAVNVTWVLILNKMISADERECEMMFCLGLANGDVPVELFYAVIYVIVPNRLRRNFQGARV